jgi:hypothetical protein
MNCLQTCLYAPGVGWGYEWVCSMISGKLSARTEQQLVSQCLTHHHNTPCDWHTMQDTFTNWSFFLCPLSRLSPYQFWLFLNCGDINQKGQSENFWAAKYLSKSTIKFTEKKILPSLAPLFLFFFSCLLLLLSPVCLSSYLYETCCTIWGAHPKFNSFK